MKAALVPSQFDGPTGRATPATPSCCCCCCCCCVATIVATPVVTAIDTSSRARHVGRSRGGPIILSALAFPVGLVVAGFVSNTIDPALGLGAGAATTVGSIALAYRSGEDEIATATVRALGVVVVASIAFALELAIGLAMVTSESILPYVYLVGALAAAGLVIRQAKLRADSRHRAPPVLDERAYLLPPPPGAEPEPTKSPRPAPPPPGAPAGDDPSR